MSAESLEGLHRKVDAALFNAQRFLDPETGDINYEALSPKQIAALSEGPGWVIRPAEQSPIHLQPDDVYQPVPEDFDEGEEFDPTPVVILESWQLFFRDFNNFSHRFFRTDIYGELNAMTPCIQRFRILFPELYEAVADYVDYRMNAILPNCTFGQTEPGHEQYARFMQKTYGIMAQLVDLGDRAGNGRSVEEYDKNNHLII